MARYQRATVSRMRQVEDREAPRVLLITVSMVVVAAMLVFAGPASAQEGCKDFGQNIAGLATNLCP